MAITNKNRTAALAYFRTSSATNVGADKDSEKRQRAAVTNITAQKIRFVPFVLPHNETEQIFTQL
jgi:hypothetical protein